MSTIQQAAQENKITIVKAHLTAIPSLLDNVDADGRTALHWACSSGAREIERFLVLQGADVNKQDQSLWTPLHIAVSAGYEDIVKDLLEAGADVKGVNDKGITPLHYAASKNRVEIGKILIDRGADINARDKANQCPLHRAATIGSTSFISLLLDPPTPPLDAPARAKTRVNTQDRVGNTPLHLAMESGHGDAAVLLIKKGADRGRTNVDGQTPEELEGLGEREGKRVKEFVVMQCGKYE